MRSRRCYGQSVWCFPVCEGNARVHVRLRLVECAARTVSARSARGRDRRVEPVYGPGAGPAVRWMEHNRPDESDLVHTAFSLRFSFSIPHLARGEDVFNLSMAVSL